MAYVRPPVVRGVGTASTSATAAAPGLPTGTIKGDLLIMFGEASGTLTATGWTNLNEGGNAAPATNTGVNLNILWKISVDGADATTTNDTGDHQAVSIIGIKAGTFDPADPFGVTQKNTQASTTSVSVPGLTTGRDQSLVLVFAAGDLPDAAGTTEWGTPTNSDLANLTEQRDVSIATGDGGSYVCISGDKAAAGSVGATTCTKANAATMANYTLEVQANPNPQVRSLGTNSGAGGALTLAQPSGVVAGDLLVAFIEASGSVTATNWTAAPGSGGVAESGSVQTILYRIATADASDTLTTSDSGDHQNGRIIAFYKDSFDATTPFNTSNSNQQGATTSGSISGVTTTRDGCLIVGAGAAPAPDANTSDYSAWACSGLDWVEELSDSFSGTGDGGGTGIGYGHDLAQGTVGAMTYTAATSATRANAMLAIQPPTTATPQELAADADTQTGVGTPRLSVPKSLAASAATQTGVGASLTVSRVLLGAAITLSAGAAALTVARLLGGSADTLTGGLARLQVGEAELVKRLRRSFGVGH